MSIKYTFIRLLVSTNLSTPFTSYNFILYWHRQVCIHQLLTYGLFYLHQQISFLKLSMSIKYTFIQLLVSANLSMSFTLYNFILYWYQQVCICQLLTYGLFYLRRQISFLKLSMSIKYTFIW